MSVDLPLEVKRSLFIRKVTRDEEEDEDDPEEESVHSEEGSVVKENPGPADERGEDSNAACESG